MLRYITSIVLPVFRQSLLKNISRSLALADLSAAIGLSQWPESRCLHFALTQGKICVGLPFL